MKRVPVEWLVCTFLALVSILFGQPGHAAPYIAVGFVLIYLQRRWP